jgi:hypothetical protein
MQLSASIEINRLFKIKIIQMKNYLLLIAALITISAGCKKDKNESPTCRISRLITPTGKEIKVTYNAEGKYAKIENTQTNETSTAAYSSNSIVITRVTTGTASLRSRTTLLLNSSGMISVQKTEYYNSSGAIVVSSTKTEFEYNGLQLIKSTTIDSFYSGPSVLTITADYTWKEGNLISNSSASYFLNYEYYTDKLVQQGDIQSIRRLIWDYDVNLHIKNKNLTKSEGSTQYTYDFDAEGKVKSLSSSGNVIYLVEYECN